MNPTFLSRTRISIAAAAATFALVGCSGSSSSMDASQLARATTSCLLEGADSDQLYDLGVQQGSGNGLAWRRLSVLGCPGTVKYWTTAEFREAVGLESTQALMHRESFRQGMYSGISPKVGVPVAERDKLGGIGLVLEKGAVSGTIALSCKAVPVTALGYLNAMSFPFALAAVGTQMPSLTDEQVYETANKLVSAIGLVTKVLAPAPDCGLDVPVAEKALEVFAQQMIHFQKGKSPYTPGCHAEVLMDDVKLICKGKSVEVPDNKLISPSAAPKASK